MISAKQDASKLLHQVSGTEVLASSIARKVRDLDVAQQRLRDSLERVDLILDLKVRVIMSRRIIIGSIMILGN